MIIRFLVVVSNHTSVEDESHRSTIQGWKKQEELVRQACFMMTGAHLLSLLFVLVHVVAIVNASSTRSDLYVVAPSSPRKSWPQSPTPAATAPPQPPISVTTAAPSREPPAGRANPTVTTASPAKGPSITPSPVVALTESPVDVPTEPPLDVPTELPVDPPTEPPLDAPTDAPVDPPTQPPEPTKAPVVAPTEAPVSEPTKAPVVAPTEAPVSEPTDAPVVTPTDAPVPEPTDAPVVAPTEAPVPEPTDAPVVAPTEAPVPEPTEAPVVSPTEAPVKPPPAPEVKECVLPDPEDVSGDGSLLVSQLIDTQAQTVTVRATSSLGGYIAFGYSQGSGMVSFSGTPNVVVVGQPGGRNVQAYTLGGKALPLVTPTNSAVSDTSFTQNNGESVLQFTKPLVEGGQVAVSATASNQFLWAHSENGELAYHGMGRGSGSTTIETCASRRFLRSG